MGDPEQTDLIEYLAGEATRVMSRLPTFPGNAEAAMACVQIEHTASFRQSERETGCVQFEHTEPASRIENSREDAEPSAAAAPMSPHRLLVCLAVIGWPERELARRTGRLQTTVRRWTGGRSPVPSDVAAWVEALAAFHRAYQAPLSFQKGRCKVPNLGNNCCSQYGNVLHNAMQIIAKRTLRVFWDSHLQARTPLQSWFATVSRSAWNSPADIKAEFGATVDFVADNRVIFDISGNKYRLVVRVAYSHKRVLIKFVGTHADYDKIDARTV